MKTKLLKPLQGRPLTKEDIIKECVEFEDRMVPHLIYEFPEEELRRELPSTKWSPAGKYSFGRQITRFVRSLIA